MVFDVHHQNQYIAEVCYLSICRPKRSYEITKLYIYSKMIKDWLEHGLQTLNIVFLRIKYAKFKESCVFN